MSVNSVNSNDGFIPKTAKAAALGGAASAGAYWLAAGQIAKDTFIKDSLAEAAVAAKESGAAEDVIKQTVEKAKEGLGEAWENLAKAGAPMTKLFNWKSCAKVAGIGAGIAGAIAAGYHLLKGSDNQ